MYTEGRIRFRDLDTSIKLDNGEVTKMLAMLFIINCFGKYICQIMLFMTTCNEFIIAILNK